MESDIQILHIEDNPVDVLLTEEALSADHFHLRNSERLSEAINLLLLEHFDVILLDLGLPDSQGLDTLRRLRKANPHIAVVVLTGNDDEELALQSLKVGAQDYLVKSDLQSGSLKRSLRYAVERRAFEKTLERSEARIQELTGERSDEETRMRAILDNISDSIIMIDKEGLVLSINRAAEEMTGFCEAELVGEPVQILTPIDARPQMTALLDRMFKREIPRVARLEVMSCRKDGSLFPIDLSLNVLSLGGSTYVIGVARDVSERKKTELELHLSKDRMELAQQQAHIGNWEVDLRTGQGIWSAELYRIYGLPQGSPVDMQTSLKLSHPADIERVEAIVQFAADNCQDFVVDYRLQRPDGSLRYLEARGECVRDESDKPSVLRGTVQDITERKHAQDKLRLSQQRMESAQQVAHVGDWEWNIAKDSFNVSDEFFRIYGLEPDSIKIDLAKGLELIHSEDRGRIADEVAEVLKTGDSHQFEYRLLRPDGELRFVDAHCVCQTDTEGQIVSLLETLQDITERKHSLLERERLEDQLRQSQKMEAIGKLAGGVAHDFNNMLSVIIGFSELTLSEIPEDSEFRENVLEIMHAGQRAALITQQLLAFSRQQVLAPRVLNLNSVVAETERMLRRLIGEDIDLVAILDPQLSPIRVDQGQIVQVVMNLAVNARDSMPQGGTLTVETSGTYVYGDRVQELEDFLPGPYVLLSVTDTGTGMTPEVKARIFEPFFTTKGPGAGTGLGLSTVYGIVKQSGGHIIAYSELGVGTTFKVYFPVAAGNEIGIGSADKGSILGQAGTETILLLEDDAPVRMVAARMLEKYGYTVLVADNSKDALDIVGNHSLSIHLLLTDLIMPGMSGRQVAEAATALRPGLKVLYMSGYTDDAVLRHGLVSASVAFLQKPFTAQSLTTKVREALGN